MNKFHILIAGLVVFAAVAQFASAGEELVSELEDDEDIDDVPEGNGPLGPRMKDKFVKHTTKSQVGIDIDPYDDYGRNINDKNVGQSLLVNTRDASARCHKRVKSKQDCANCCSEDGVQRSSERVRIFFYPFYECNCYRVDNNWDKP